MQLYTRTTTPPLFSFHLLCVLLVSRKFPPLSPTVYPPFASPLFIYVCVEMSRATLWFVNAPTNVFNYYWPDEKDREANWWISWPLIWQLVLTWWWWIDNDEKQVWRIFSFFNFSTSKGGTNEWTNDRYDVTCINAHAMNPACRQKINFFFTTKRHWAAAIAAVRIVVL